MTWQTGTSNEYKDLFSKLVAVATGNHADSATVSAGGTGYTVGDILTVSGGTSTFAATFRVLTAPAGVVGTVGVVTGGAYTANPSNPASTTGGTGTGCTLNLTMSATGWTIVRLTRQAVSATVAAGGSGYSVGNTLTLVGGNFTTAATFTVATLGGGGAVATVTLATAGEYRDIPSNPVSVTGGAGTGATLTVTWAEYSGANEKECILQGVGSGSDTIYVGIKTYSQVNGADTARNWTLVGMTGFNSSLAFDAQPGVSPGGIPSASGGAYVPLKATDAFPMSFWFNITGRRIIGVAKIETATVTNFASWYLGFLNPYGTSTEMPYPIFVAGCTARHDCLFNTTAPSITGLTEMVGINGRTGPAYGRLPNSTWVTVRNSIAVDSGSPTRAQNQDYLVYPCGKTTITGVATDDFIVNDNVFDWLSMIPGTGIPGTAAERLQPTPNTAGALRFLVPATITYSNSPDFDIWGEMDGVFWVSQAGGEANLDTITVSGVPYLMVQCGVRSTIFSFMAIKES